MNFTPYQLTVNRSMSDKETDRGKREMFFKNSGGRGCAQSLL